MKKTTSYSREIWERAVRMVFEHQGEHDSQWAAIGSISAKNLLYGRDLAQMDETISSIIVFLVKCRHK